MTPHRKRGWRRLTKTHGMFEAIPTLRVPGRDMPAANAMPRRAPVPKKPAHFADPTLFPGRRLDRHQQSTYSLVSGISGLSGIDQLTLPSSGRGRGPGSTAGSTRLSHISLPAVGANHNRTFASEGNDLWDLERQDTPLTVHRRHAAGAEDEEDGRMSSVPALPPQSSFAKVSRWQMANFTQASQRHKPVCLETREVLLESPDSTESGQSDRQPPVQREALLSKETPRPEPPKEAPPVNEQTWGKMASGPLKVNSSFLPQQQRHGARYINPHRRPAQTPTVSPTPPPETGPRLNKILWALAPDEHANMSDAGASHKQSSWQGTSIFGDNKPPRALHKTVTVTDLEVDSDIACSVPETPRNPQLTKQLLLDHNESGTWPRDDRIQQWLADCDHETTSQSLPTHLPDIQYTFRHLHS